MANLSFGGIGYSSAMRLAISNSVAKGVVFVVSAGNDNATTDANGIAKFQYKISSNRDGVGTFTATVTGSKNGYNPGCGSRTFTVTR